ncbi:MAG: ABA4-like family protein [Bacteroidota bacterium]
MTPTTVFSLANLLVMPMWILMILLPKWKVTRFLMDHKLIPILLSVIYAIYIVLSIQGGTGLDFGSLESVMGLFTVENATLAGWVHYLAFDLLIGFWMIEQNRTIGIHQILMAPCLFGTFMLGPVGFLLFLLLRTLKAKKS